MNNEHSFPYRWNLKDGYPAKGIEKHNLKVFGTFICGGGSTMGYKLAGYDHLGGVEIDKPIADVYKENHNPKYLYNEDIRDFLKRKDSDIPKELFDLDIFDGSPPCSSFSTAGSREKGWGKEKVFREGQTMQTLDDLFFTFIAVAKRLQPKVILAENVSGLIKGNAKAYVRQIRKDFDEAGYNVQLFLLNAASMGVPQKRERVFFICSRNDLNLPKLQISFNEKAILYKEIRYKLSENILLSELYTRYWYNSKQGDALGKSFSDYRMNDSETPNTIKASGGLLSDSIEPRSLNKLELCLIGSYPLDYNFQTINPKYLIGMSVPPVMTAQISHQIYLQWLSKPSKT
jgi:DNA (cytosine-5)-methyltransferase 1